ncbi:unnamed protein product, partial [Tuber aestivum]
MSKLKGEQSSAYRGDEEGGEVTGGSSSAATPPPIQRKLDNPGEALPEYYDSIGGSTKPVRGVMRGETGAEGEAGAGAPPEFEVYVPKTKVKHANTILAPEGDVLTVSHDEHLNTDGEALYRWFLEQRSRPPRVQVRVHGYHSEWSFSQRRFKAVTDFHLICDFTHLLLEQNHIGEPTLATVPPDKKAHRGHGGFKSLAKDLEEGGTVRDWADRYCEDQSTFKESDHRFVMKKVVLGHDRDYLMRRITECIRSTNYPHNISFEFPIYNTRVKVYPENRISKLRKAEWFRWIFYLTFLWIFAWPYLWLVTKRYNVTRMTWRMSRRVRDESGETRRECVQTEGEWMRQWGPAIKRAVTAKKQ